MVRSAFVSFFFFFYFVANPQFPHSIWICFWKNSILGCACTIQSCLFCSWLVILHILGRYLVQCFENVWRIQFHFILRPKGHWNYNISPWCPLHAASCEQILSLFFFFFVFWNTPMLIFKLLMLPEGAYSVAWLKRDLSTTMYWPDANFANINSPE